MLSKKKALEAINETYRMLYKEATPSADYDELVANCCRYADENNNIQVTEQPLSKEEMLSRGWKKAIDYMSYYLDQKRYNEIVEAQAAKYKIKGCELNGFRMEMYLGHGPTSCSAEDLKKRKEDGRTEGNTATVD